MTDIQSLVNAMSDGWRKDRSRYHLTLGQLIEKLKTMAPELVVQFDEGGHPCSAHSYRGYYSDLSFESSAESVTVAQFPPFVEACLGNTYEGYKGGDYTMGLETPLWTAPYGCCGRAIMGITDLADHAILVTKEIAL